MLQALQNPSVKKIIGDAIGGCDKQTATVLDLSAVHLYTCEEGKHRFHHSRIAGILALLIDRREGKVYIVMILQVLLPKNLSSSSLDSQILY